MGMRMRLCVKCGFLCLSDVCVCAFACVSAFVCVCSRARECEEICLTDVCLYV